LQVELVIIEYKFIRISKFGFERMKSKKLQF